MDSVHPTDCVEEALLCDALGGVLARDALADMDFPPFHRATMDGYAVISADGPGDYEVVEDIPAGHYPAIPLSRGKVSKIMTGAPMPDGADAVVPVEKTGGFVHVGQVAQIIGQAAPGSNFSPRGEDMRSGDVAMAGGSVIRPAEVALLASVGAEPCHIFRRPTLAALATGDELVHPSRKPIQGQIRNSNGPTIMAMAAAMGITATNLGAAGDSPASLEEKIRLGMEHDFLIISGGVSAGDRDFVPEIAKKLGYRILFHKIRVKPGKPTLFAVSEKGRYLFGLPGNPVSSMVIFELFVRPALLRFQGAPAATMEVSARLEATYRRKKADREEYLPGRLFWKEGCFGAELAQYHGSGHFRALTTANGLVTIPIGVFEAPKGSMVAARFLGDRITLCP